MVACVAIGVWPAVAQENTFDRSETVVAKQSHVSSSRADNEAEIEKHEQSQRVLGVMPMFGVTDRPDARPLSTRQKFHLAFKGSLDPFEFASTGVQAGLSQAQREFPAYGQGVAGYSKRYGAALTDDVSGQFFSNFLYPTLLKEDPRYFRLGHGSIRHRIGYALLQEFVCRRDRGGRSFNYSNILGSVSTGALANLYYPPSERGFQLTMSRAAVAVVGDSAGGLMSEFWEDIRDKISRKHHAHIASTPHDEVRGTGSGSSDREASRQPLETPDH
jgi:hypothetical protein